MNKSHLNYARSPGFSAEASLYRTGESYYLLNNEDRLYTSIVLTPAFGGCPGCARVCDQCNQCLRIAQPKSCTFVCGHCWACDCPR